MIPSKVSGNGPQGRSGQRALSIGEFTHRYGVGRTTTYEEIKSGRLRARKIGKRTIIGVDDETAGAALARRILHPFEAAASHRV